MVTCQGSSGVFSHQIQFAQGGWSNFLGGRIFSYFGGEEFPPRERVVRRVPAATALVRDGTSVFGVRVTSLNHLTTCRRVPAGCSDRVKSGSPSWPLPLSSRS